MLANLESSSQTMPAGFNAQADALDTAVSVYDQAAMTETRHPPDESPTDAVTSRLRGLALWTELATGPWQRHASTEGVRHANRARNVTGAGQQR